MDADALGYIKKQEDEMNVKKKSIRCFQRNTRGQRYIYIFAVISKFDRGIIVTDLEKTKTLFGLYFRFV